MVNNDFKTLIDFLDRLGPEVSGRVLSQPHSAAAARLEKFAIGQCNENEVREVCEMLKLHPAWLRWLADRVKLSRSIHAAPSTANG